ncbi:hypothetical protein C7M84_008566 [Penaeus vannamei]|uniref:Uncharacterized protein n=2 Tax=Penaeus vannamei TaxID=6689 RepID=A0A423T967_PENVA|nr:hypothetical protein C7M84_008566 [Penaeus vannamei]
MVSPFQVFHENGLPVNASDSETATEIPNNTNTTQKVTFPPEFSEAKTDGFETLAGSGSITTATINARTEIASTEGSNTQPTIGTQLKASTASVSNTEASNIDSEPEGESSEESG